MIRVATCAIAALLIAACSSSPKPTTLDLSLVASEQLNPTVQRRPSPAMVRYFELKNSAGFESADYNGLFDGDKDKLTLNTDLVDRKEFFMKPGETVPIVKELAPGTTAIGVAVGFRALDRAAWRVVVPIKPNAKNVVVLQLDALAITVKK
ncbi:type VI secretion system lipoprotein TssJ [soil metagenome]